MKAALLFLLGAAVAAASPFRYDVVAEAVTTGPVQADAFSLSFMVDDLYTTQGVTTDVKNNPTLVFSAPLDPAHPTLFSVLINPGLQGSYGGGLDVNFGTPGDIIHAGSGVAGLMDQPGTYNAFWQLIKFDSNGQTTGATVSATITITDLGTQTSGVPEPGTFGLAAAGAAAVLLISRRRRTA